MAVEAVEIVLQGVDNATPAIDKVNQKLISSEEKYISKLKEQLIAQTQGAEAANRFKLAEMGFSEATIETAMALIQQTEAAKAAKAAAEELEKSMMAAVKKPQDELKELNDLIDGRDRGPALGLDFDEAGIQGVADEMSNLADESDKSSSNAKKLSGILGAAFGAAGLGELKVFTEHIGGLKEKVDLLKQESEKGGKAFKALAAAGLAIGTAVAAFNVGKMIGDWVFETERWKNALKDALNELSNGEDQVRKKLDKQFELRLKLAEAAADPKQKEDELQAIQKRLEFDIANQRGLLNLAESSQKKLQDSMWAGINKAEIEVAKSATEEEKKKLQLLQDQLDKVREIRNPSSEQQALDARLKANEEAKQAAADQLQAERDRFQEWSKNWDDAKAKEEAKQKQADDYLASLQLQNEELKNGKRAAEEMRASFAGISEEVILQGREIAIQNELMTAQKQLADEQKKKEEERQKALAAPTAPLQAMQSRLLTRVSTSGGDRVAKASEKTAELTEKIEGLQREQLALQKRRGILELATLEGQ